MKDLSGKVVLVTGAGKGAGRAIAQSFASQGAILAINDLTPINLDQTEADILAAGGQAKSYVVDVTKKLPIQGLVKSVVEDWERIDILVTCAQVKPVSSLLDMDDWDWQRTLDVNLSGVFLIMQSAGRIMRTQGGGKMLTISPYSDPEPNQAAYQISKTGMAELSRLAKEEFSKFGIQVHHIHPKDEADLVRQALAFCIRDNPKE